MSRRQACPGRAAADRTNARPVLAPSDRCRRTFPLTAAARREALIPIACHEQGTLTTSHTLTSYPGFWNPTGRSSGFLLQQKRQSVSESRHILREQNSGRIAFASSTVAKDAKDAQGASVPSESRVWSSHSVPSGSRSTAASWESASAAHDATMQHPTTKQPKPEVLLISRIPVSIE